MNASQSDENSDNRQQTISQPNTSQPDTSQLDTSQPNTSQPSQSATADITRGSVTDAEIIEVIEKAGESILKDYCYKREGPTMLPPIPNGNKFIDSYPDNEDQQTKENIEDRNKQRGYEADNPDNEDQLTKENIEDRNKQRGYEAEVKMFRLFEGLKNLQLIVLHSLECTNRQFALFVPAHREKMKKKPDKLLPNRKAMQCDLIAFSKDYFVAIEVSYVQVDSSKKEKHIRNAYKDKKRQGERAKELIEAILGRYSTKSASDIPTDNVTWFCAFPNLSEESVTNFSDEEKKRIIFKDVTDDIECFSTWWSENVTKQFKKSCERDDRMKYATEILIGLWSIDSGNKCDQEEKCSLEKNIPNTEKQLKNADISFGFRFVEDDSRKAQMSQKKGSDPNDYINPNFVLADDVFRKIGIKYLSKEQEKVFKSDKKFLWVEGPAGTGKTVLILGKVIQLLTETQKKVILITNMSVDYCRNNYEDRLKRAGFSTHYTEEVHMDPASVLNLLDPSFECDVVISHIRRTVSVRMANVNPTSADDRKERLESILPARLLGAFHFFIDDESTFLGRNLMGDTNITDILEYLDDKKSDSVVWTFTDDAQSRRIQSSVQPPSQQTTGNQQPLSDKSAEHIFRLEMNLRNTCDIANMLSEIRKVMNEREQVPGHFIHGSLPVIHLLKTCQFELITLKVFEEVDRIFDTPDKHTYKVPLIMTRCLHRHVIGMIKKDTNPRKDLIEAADIDEISSTEWPAAVILIDVTQLNFSELYLAVSRPTVHCCLILYHYSEGKNVDLDRLLNILERSQLTETKTTENINLVPENRDNQYYRECPVSSCGTWLTWMIHFSEDFEPRNPVFDVPKSRLIQ